MKNLNYFKQCKTLDDVKREYKQLMEQWHPNVAPEGDSSTFARRSLGVGELRSLLPEFEFCHISKQ